MTSEEVRRAISALDKAAEKEPDIVLLDIVMPDLDGIEVMRQLRERRPVPVILLTALASDDAVAEGIRAGANAYMTKPFRLLDLGGPRLRHGGECFGDRGGRLETPRRGSHRPARHSCRASEST